MRIFLINTPMYYFAAFLAQPMSMYLTDLVLTVQTNMSDNSYLLPSTKGDDDVKLEGKAVNRLEYEERVKDLEELIQKLQRQENSR